MRLFLVKKFVFISTVFASSFILTLPSRGDTTLPPMKPLSRFIAENNLNDLVAASYIMARCFSYYSVISHFLSNTNNPEYQAGQRAADAAQRKYYDAWIGISTKLDPKLNSAQRTKQLETTATSIIKAYAERANATRARTGNMFEDPVLKDDGEKCLLIHDTILSRLF